MGARAGASAPLPPGAAWTAADPSGFEREFNLGSGDLTLAAHLMIPSGVAGVVVLTDGSEGGWRGPWHLLASALNQAGLGTLEVGLLMPEEERGNVFNVRMLARRLTAVTRWLLCHPASRGLPVGYLGTGTTAAAALWAAAAEPRVPVAAIVCQDGRPDLAWPQLSFVRPPTLLVVGCADPVLLGLNRQARQQLRCESDLAVIAGSGRLLNQPGALEQVGRLSVAWFTRHFMPAAGTTPPG